MCGCVHQVAVHEHVSDRFLLAYTPCVLRVFCSDGFPYVIAPAFSTPAFSTPAFSAPPTIGPIQYDTGWDSTHCAQKQMAIERQLSPLHETKQKIEKKLKWNLMSIRNLKKNKTPIHLKCTFDQFPFFIQLNPHLLLWPVLAHFPQAIFQILRRTI